MARNPHREDRRRRVLRDESRTTTKKTRRRTSGTSVDRAYSERALEKNQPRVTDCLPMRGMSMFYLFSLGVAAIGSVLSLHVARQAYLHKVRQIETSWLALDGPMTLAGYLAASLLIVTAIISLVVFHIRRHKIDDYKGRYRMWYLVVAVLGIASIDVITHAHRGLRDVTLLLVDKTPGQNPATWWVLVWSVVGGLVAIRALIEVRRCRLAVCTWLLAAGCLAGSAVLYLRIFEIAAPQAHLMARSALFLFGLHLLMFGTAQYARFVYLAAQGQKKVKKATTKTKKTTTNSEEKRTGLFTLPRLGRGKSQQRKPKKPAKKVAADADDGDYEEELEGDYEDDYEEQSNEPTEAELELLTSPDLTRSERRKLKRQMKERRRRAAA